jgi:gamma-glutamylcyclotransferase (GGCT)/AIG2-like uncharacterized protein YtfP
VFVYGTLKRGERNHGRYCPGALRVEPATVSGHLYDLPGGHPDLGPGYGYPALVVPWASILATGTTDYAADAALEPPAAVTGEQAPPVHGELLAFDDPESRLPALDALEGYVPGTESPYRRVLVPAAIPGAGERVAAWTYVVDEPVGTYLSGGRWPEQ